MATAAKTWVPIYEDEILKENGRYFFIEQSEYDLIRQRHLANDFRDAAAEALTFLSERVELADDLSELILFENFQFHQAKAEGLTVDWTIEYQESSGRYLAVKTDDTF